mmetsp:Transcript_2073/g.5961  ORF Transcript_2073/g.5961 Transcript_2073/m.5961 type:complete len:142 (-) Transcript_2073:411-836(-)
MWAGWAHHVTRSHSPSTDVRFEQTGSSARGVPRARIRFADIDRLTLEVGARVGTRVDIKVDVLLHVEDLPSGRQHHVGTVGFAKDRRIPRPAVHIRSQNPSCVRRRRDARRRDAELFGLRRVLVLDPLLLVQAVLRLRTRR